MPVAFALDKDSVRTLDADGRLHVKISHISKACVNPYRGSEIPNWESLGLNADAIYQMFRHPDELAAAAATSNNIQLLDDHIAVNAEKPEKMSVVGSTGTDGIFTSPYLDNSLVIWDREAIDRIANGEQKELSSSYRYDPDMTAGEFQGFKYDGIMRNIVLNHVALVKSGRAGPDVVVSDNALTLTLTQILETEIDMPPKAKLPSRTASRVGVALSAYALPLLAKDKKVDFAKIVAGVTYINVFAKDGKTIKKDAIKKIVDLARDAMEPMLDPAAVATAGSPAKAVGPDDVIMRLVEHAIESAAPAEIEADTMDPLTAAAASDPATMDDPAAAGAGNPELMAFLQSLGLDEATIAKIVEMCGPAKKAEGTEPAADPTATEDEDEKEKDDKPAKDEPMPKNMVTKEAMDAALKRTADETAASIRKDMTATAEAREFVRPWVGSISMAHDSVAGVYKATLKALGTDADAVKDTEALRLMITLKAKPNDRAVSHASDAELDGGTISALDKRFPGAARISLG